MFKCMTTFITSHQVSSTLINPHQVSSTLTNSHQPSSSLTNFQAMFLPVAAISERRNDESPWVSQIFIAIINICRDHTNHHWLLLKIISQLSQPLEIIRITNAIFVHLFHYISCYTQKEQRRKALWSQKPHWTQELWNVDHRNIDGRPKKELTVNINDSESS